MDVGQLLNDILIDTFIFIFNIPIVSIGVLNISFGVLLLSILLLKVLGRSIKKIRL